MTEPSAVPVPLVTVIIHELALGPADGALPRLGPDDEPEFLSSSPRALPIGADATGGLLPYD